MPAATADKTINEILGLEGFRPKEGIAAAEFFSPPYDVIKQGSALERILKSRPRSLMHVTLGDRFEEDPKKVLAALKGKRKGEIEAYLIEDNTPSFYIYEQTYEDGSIRLGVFVAAEVSDYSEGKIIKHEKIFKDKAQERAKLARDLGCNPEPIFLLTKQSLAEILRDTIRDQKPTYNFTADFSSTNNSDMHGIRNRIFRVEAASEVGIKIAQRIGRDRLYIADGHHRYAAAIENEQSHVMAYVTDVEQIRTTDSIQAYNRVINPVREFKPFSAEVHKYFSVRKVDEFVTPGKNEFCVYTNKGTYLLKVKQKYVPKRNVVKSLDCSILENTLYKILGLSHDMIKDTAHFDYYPDNQLQEMQTQVRDGRYALAIALHPVSPDELLKVADAGIINPEVVMPEKSTYFKKILSGTIIDKDRKRKAG